MPEIAFKPFYTWYVLMHGLQTARETITMTYSTINFNSFAHVYNIILKLFHACMFQPKLHCNTCQQPGYNFSPD